MPLLGQRTQTFAEQAHSRRFERQLLVLGAKQMPPDPDNVANIQRLKQTIAVFSKPLLSYIDLQTPAPILDMKKRRLAEVAGPPDPPGEMNIAWRSRLRFVVGTGEPLP